LVSDSIRIWGREKGGEGEIIPGVLEGF